MANQHTKVKLHFVDDYTSFNNPTTNVILTLTIFNIIKPTLPSNKDDVDKLIKILKEKL
ncbi:hypothetical protein QTI92_10985 [Clostridium perfringens]|uniref:hypothetical protein n=1 Tax=Clostridium perfringens TaxID=1502 RepID=UPI001CCCBC06|nr:hypothetical protein [Clostridium perfringens]MDK0938282.1 hypothetical protein [Clostridium perfringens]MDM0961258.1 hypothetical protein [Clostridium perfringens]MDM0972707.1 hypothetical protein [Clostridium perfringens]MDU2435049.1 hypothetical protein [Clostridium perfringens]MDU2516081.1 hypothetical protein [Clostridium perfringens]